MRRSVLLLLTCLLALITGSALLYAAVTVTIPVSEVASSDDQNNQIEIAANKEVVRRFYDAVNQTLRTANPAALDGLVAADLVEHAARPGVPPSRAGLVEYLVGLGAAFPEMRLTAVSLLAQGDEVMARVRVDGAERGAFLGVPLAGERAAWGPLDVFRIVDGTIVELWGSQDGTVLLRPFSEAALTLPVADGASVRVERLTYAPGSTFAVNPQRQLRLLYLEAGALRVDIDEVAFLDRSPSGSDPEERHATVREGTIDLLPGDLLVLSVASPHVARNDGPTTAVTMEVTLTPTRRLTPLSDGAGSASATGNVTAQLLSSGSVAASTEPATVAVGRAELAPGTRIPAHAVAGAELIYVADGVLAVPVGNRPDGDGAPPTAVEDTFVTGEAVLLAPGTVDTLRSARDRPTSLVVVAVNPGGSVAS